MQTNHPLFDDLAKLASGAAGAALEIKREIEAQVTAQMEKMLQKLNLVKREEFEAVREMAARARAQQEEMEARLAALEKKAGSQSGGKKSSRAAASD